MTTISDKNTTCTLIDVFTVDPEKQPELLEVLKEATDKVVCKMKGYISANLHVSDDKKTVTNYAQWKSVEDFTAMQQAPEVQEHMQKAAALAIEYKPVTYNFIWTHSLMDVLLEEAAQESQEAARETQETAREAQQSASETAPEEQEDAD